MRLVEVKSSNGGRYAYMDTESNHLNCIQIRKILPHILYHITLGWEPCLCTLFLWLQRDVTDLQQSFLHLPCFMSSKKTHGDCTCAFMVAFVGLWRKLPAMPSTRSKFSPFKRGLGFLFTFLSTYRYVFFFTSQKKNIVCGTII